MKKTLTLVALAAPLSMVALAQAQRAMNPKEIVDLELLTHTDVSEKLRDGYTSILLVAGGTEERGPQDVLGGHTIMAKHHAIEIANRVGKTLVAPILPIAVNATGLRE